MFQNRARQVREARLLIDPARDPVEQWLRVDWRKPLCPIRPAEDLSSTARTQVDKTLEVFRINSDPRLVRVRMRVVDIVLNYLEKDQTARARSRAIRFRAHSLVARQILLDKIQALASTQDEIRLPSPQEELRWLLNDHLGELALKILDEQGPNKTAEKLKEEVLWSFAILWDDSPGGMHAEVEAFLTQNEILDPVREYAQGLNTISPRLKPRA